MHEWDTDEYRADRDRLYDAIRAEFPELVTRRFECYSGWFPILRQFFATASDALKDHPEREFALLQIKEKFGALCIYYRLIPFQFGVEDVIGGRISAAYRVAEETAAMTCDVCGKPGVLRVRNGWYATRCEDHADRGVPFPPPEGAP